MQQALLLHFGLAKPHRFERTLTSLAAILLLLVIGLTAIYLWARGHLVEGSPRAWYLVYLAGLLVLALVLAPRPRLSTALVLLAALEAGLGLGSLALYKVGLVPVEILAPSDRQRPAFTWHPLLQAKPVPGNNAGAWAVSSEGWRGPERSAAELRGKIGVALFGGSSTFDGQQRDGQSWPDRLQVLLGAGYAILNRGMGGYTTAEHVIQTAFYGRTKGIAPTCAVYYVGWNDIRNSHIADLDPGYADFHLPNQIGSFGGRRTDLHNSISPLAKLVGRLVGYSFDTVRPTLPIGRTSSDPDPVLEATFASNVGAISAINRQRGIHTIWVGQLMNQAALTADTPSSWIPFVRDKDVYGLIQRLNGILKKQAAALGDVYIGLPAAQFGLGEFRDHGHFTPAGSLKFATLLAPTIEATCRSSK